MSKVFLRVKSRAEVEKIIRSFSALGTETVRLTDALGRVVAQEVRAIDPVPHFSRATMDGYAVRARDVFGASESLPALLKVVGSVEMGKAPNFTVGPNQAAEIATGGMLPDGADAVVMVEHTEKVDEHEIEVYRPVAPGQNVLGVGEDIPAGKSVLSPGVRLRPQDLGVLAAVGITEVMVYRRPKVAVISTGDEIVPPDTPSPLPPALIRDINAYVLSGFAEMTGAITGEVTHVKDSARELVRVCSSCLADHDVVLVSGGSSVGVRDYTLEVFETITDGQILVHGVAIRPGKPTIFGIGRGKYLWGLPGQPASAAMVMVALVCPFLLQIQGLEPEFPFCRGMLKGLLTQNVPSVHGREDYVPVVVSPDGKETVKVEPIFGRSGMISTLSRANGYIVIPEHAEGLYEGEEVPVYLL